MKQIAIAILIFFCMAGSAYANDGAQTAVRTGKFNGVTATVGDYFDAIALWDLSTFVTTEAGLYSALGDVDEFVETNDDAELNSVTLPSHTDPTTYYNVTDEDDSDIWVGVNADADADADDDYEIRESETPGTGVRIAFPASGGAKLTERTAPSNPASNTCIIFLDSSDGDLKVIFDSGSAVTIGTHP